MGYVRFVLGKRHPASGFPDGVFRTAYALVRDSGEISQADREALKDQLIWFEEHLPVPKRFNKTISKGYYRRNTRGIAWFREQAVEHITRMNEIKRVFEANGHTVHMVREERVGYVVYRDDFQVIAEPFADTRTGAELI
jgi:hypothetical protein